MHASLPPLLAAFILPAHGLIFLNNADPPANKETAPTGAYADSGWQYQIKYTAVNGQQFQGTMISPKHFITAAHLGQTGTVTQPDFFHGGTGTKTFTLKNGGLWQRIGDTDLSIFEIWETFDDFAPLYTATNETGKEYVISGKGRERGAAVVVTGTTVGWEWGTPATEAHRWGTSTVIGPISDSLGSSLLMAQFDPNGGTHEAQTTGNDSGGGWFIKDGSTWKLAAITFSADSGRDSNNITGDASNFRCASFKARGLYWGSDSSAWTLIPTSNSSYNGNTSYLTNPNDSRFYDRTHSYGTRISAYQNDINTIIQPALNLANLTPTQLLTNWLNTAGLTTQTSPSDDPDNDGLPNLIEYLSESDPNDQDTAISPLQTDLLPDGSLTFTLTETLDLAGRGLTYTIQQSPDLTTWTPIGTTTETSNTIDATNGTRTRILQLPAPTQNILLFRLQVTLN